MVVQTIFEYTAKIVSDIELKIKRTPHGLTLLHYSSGPLPQNKNRKNAMKNGNGNSPVN